MMIQLGLSIAGLSTAGRASGQPALEPGDTTSVTLDEFSRDRTIFDSGAARGQNAVAIPLTATSVDASDGREVEVRFVTADTGAQVYPWRKLAGTLSGGTLSATYFQPTGARSTHWLRPQARVVGSSVVTEASNTCGVGHVWAMWGQSNWAKIFNVYNSNLASLYNPVINEGDVQVMHWTDGAAVAVSEANKGSTPITPAIVDFANALQAVRPGEKFMILGHTKGGTNYESALTPADTGNNVLDDRDWADELALHTYATADGTQVGAVWNMGWAASNWSNTYAEKTTIRFLGKNLNGDPVNEARGVLPRQWPSNTTYGEDQNGIYDWTYTKFGYVGTHGRTRTSIRKLDAANVTDFSEFPGYDADDDQVHRKLVSEINAVFTSTGAFPETLPYAGLTIGGERGSGSLDGGDDLAHHKASDELGQQRLARIGAHNMMQSLGWLDSPLPRLDRRHDETGGAWVDHWIDGNNTLTTLRKVVPASDKHEATVQSLASQGATIPADKDHRTELMGWAINRMPAQRAELHTVTQAEVDAGHPADVGQVVARVWPNFGGTFTFADEVAYGIDPMPGYQVHDDGGTLTESGRGQRTFLDWMVVDMGQPSEVIEWLPVQQQALTFNLPTTLPAPSLFFAPGGTHIVSGASGARAASSLRVVIHGRVDDLVGGRKLFSASGDNVNARVTSNGNVDLKLGGEELFLPELIQEGVIFYVEFHFVPGDRIEAIDIDGNVIATTTSNRPDLPISGADQLSFLAQTNSRDNMGDCSIIEMAFYVGRADTSGTPDYAIRGVPDAPYYALIGFEASGIAGGTISASTL